MQSICNFEMDFGRETNIMLINKDISVDGTNLYSFSPINKIFLKIVEGSNKIEYDLIKPIFSRNAFQINFKSG